MRNTLKIQDEPNKDSLIDCHLCLKQKQIYLIKQEGRRDYSVQSIYHKDYSKKTYNPITNYSLGKNRKNESSLQTQSKSYFDINSTYLANFKATNPEKRLYKPKNSIQNKQRLPDSCTSTYASNYNPYPQIRQQQSFKTADSQFYKMQIPLSKITEYNKNYIIRPTNQLLPPITTQPKQQNIKPIRLFQSTNKHSYSTRANIDANCPIIPKQNLVNLQTQSFLYNTSYKSQFLETKKELSTIEPIQSIGCMKRRKGHCNQFYKI